MFGSCRKIHGPDYDCLSRGDDVIKSNQKDISKRPSALFLGGDQIYADDVSSVMMPMVMELGEAIVGKEKLAGVEDELPYKFGSRGYLMKSFGLEKLGHYADNHLMKFGEFVAMYCLAWNPDLWQKGFISKAKKKVIDDFVCEGEKDDTKAVKKRFKKHTDEIQLVQQFLLSLKNVRKLLANIPTYMIFDDHEISDDWNITQEWKEKMIEEHLACQTLSNGIAAYWLFQAWGNNPSMFSDSFVNSIVEFTEKTSKPNPPSHYDYKSFYGLKSFGGQWDFTTPTFPKALFLDTRTKRFYELYSDREAFSLDRIKDIIAKGINKAVNFSLEQLNQLKKKIGDEETMSKRFSPQLIKSEHLEILKSKFPFEGETFFLVTATPLFGIQRIEDTFRLGNLFLNTEAFDSESWAANYDGYLAFLKFLINDVKAKNCIILSGDVHYGFVNECKIKIDGANHPTTFTQITSSSLKNNSKNQLTPSVVNILERLEENTEPFKIHEDIEWTEHRTYFPIENGDSEQTKIIAENNLGLLKYENTLLEYQFLYLRDNNKPNCLLYTSPSPRDQRGSRMPSSA